MNKEQRTYLSDRLYQIQRNKINDLLRPTVPTVDEVIEAIKNDTFGIEYSYGKRTVSGLTTTKYLEEQSEYREKEAEIVKESQRIKDRIMLGEETDVLELLEKFADA